MNTDVKTLVLASLAVMTMLVTASLLFTGESDAADAQEYDVDLGTKYSYEVQFVFAGSDAESVTWDFGDGTPTVTGDADNPEGWNPQHTYAKADTYYVTQTVHNSYDVDPDDGVDGSTVSSVYKLTIAGYPTVSFVSNGGSAVQTIQMDDWGVAATEPAEPTRAGFTFGGWFTDADLTQEYDWNSAVKQPVILYAKWVAGTVTVSFDLDGGMGSANPQIIDYGAKATEPSEPTKVGHTFQGWFLGSEEFDFNDPVTDNITLVAKWTPNTYIVSFNLGYEGGENFTRSVTYGSLVTEPTAPTRADYLFNGWNLNGQRFNFTTPITGDITLYAQWIPVSEEDTYWQLSFNAVGGAAEFSTATVLDGESIELPDAVRDGYVLDGWFVGDKLIGQPGDSYTPTSDATIVAQWSVAPVDEPEDSTFEYILIGIVIVVIIALAAFLVMRRDGRF